VSFLDVLVQLVDVLQPVGRSANLPPSSSEGAHSPAEALPLGIGVDAYGAPLVIAFAAVRVVWSGVGAAVAHACAPAR